MIEGPASVEEILMSPKGDKRETRIDNSKPAASAHQVMFVFLNFTEHSFWLQKRSTNICIRKLSKVLTFIGRSSPTHQLS